VKAILGTLDFGEEFNQPVTYQTEISIPEIYAKTMKDVIPKNIKVVDFY